jgi:AraC family transcriptional regulator of adaptative response/methylated-DNA-[protein]-cysteine methyltransferase
MTNNNHLPLDAGQAWQQVLARDVAADGCFVYAVESTGIFCRPSCPSRRPAQRNVRFFADAERAVAAGFRACRRCHPAGMHAEAEMVARLCSYIEKRLERMVTLKELGAHAGFSPFTVQRMFERVLGVSPRHYQIEMRAERLRAGLPLAANVTDALYDAGYSSSSRMYEDADTALGMHPRRFQRGGAGETISFLVTDCPLGKLLVASTERGLCRVSLGDDAASLESELRSGFSAATIVSSDDERDDDRDGERACGSSRMRDVVAAILSTLTEHPAALDLPLDLRASAFQLRVWRALRAIPRGETRSYSQLAAEIDRPRAVRAVAQACARNPVALVIPCHRVIGRDGAISGYHWGVERKQKLLELEKRGAVS